MADRGNRDRGGAGDDLITFRIRRSVLYAVAGLAVGLSVGFFVGRSTGGADGDTQQPVAGATAPAAPPKVQEIDVEGRPARGPEDAKVTVVEFTDYECPFCGRYFNETYRPLLEAYEGRIRYVVRNFPITTIHANAQKAAEAAECAHAQGKFWRYHDILFRNQAALTVPDLKRYATEAGVDRKKFDQCLDEGAKAAVVNRDLEDGKRYGVRGTPTFFINGEFTAGAKSLDEFRALIDPKLR